MDIVSGIITIIVCHYYRAKLLFVEPFVVSIGRLKGRKTSIRLLAAFV